MSIGFVRKTVKSAISPVISALWVPLVYAALGSIGLILSLWTSGDILQDERYMNNTPSNEETFDFIIVGSGSAGSVVANRLSRKYRVLLLEAGGEPNPLQYVPGMGLFLVNYGETDWKHKTVPQTHGSLNSVNQRSSWSAGKTLGGTGTLNLMIHLRGHQNDFDNWGNITGDPSWNWNSVLKYFQMHEDYEEGGNPKYHGFGNDLRIETPDWNGVGKEFVRAGIEYGYPHCDLNGPFREGFDLIKHPVKNGIRQAPYKAFLEPIRHTRKNLVISKFSHVNRLLIKNNDCYGVEYDKYGGTRFAYASKEVIVSAGTVNSAKLLMLSGIGPKDHLEELGIPVIQDLPVGQNLQDHVAVYLAPFFINQPKSIMLERDLTPSAIVQWFISGRGIMGTTGTIASGFVSSSFAKKREERDWPDLHFILFGYSVYKRMAEQFAHTFGLTVDEQKQFWKHAVDKEAFLAAVGGARPFSRGYMKLGGSSYYDAPVIDPKYLTDEANIDTLTLIEGCKRLLTIVENSTALGSDLGARYSSQPLPGCEHLPFRSDLYWECHVRRFTVTLHHPVGTAAMGSVVDSKLRVLGVHNLRVIDASVQPTIVVSNTQASTLMIGEKGADMILNQWKDEASEFNYAPPPVSPNYLDNEIPHGHNPRPVPKPVQDEYYHVYDHHHSAEELHNPVSQQLHRPQPGSQSLHSLRGHDHRQEHSYGSPYQPHSPYTPPHSPHTPPIGHPPVSIPNIPSIPEQAHPYVSNRPLASYPPSHLPQQAPKVVLLQRPPSSQHLQASVQNVPVPAPIQGPSHGPLYLLNPPSLHVPSHQQVSSYYRQGSIDTWPPRASSSLLAYQNATATAKLLYPNFKPIVSNYI